MEGNEIIDLLVRNEIVMQELYRAYAKTFPIFESFWSSIAKDEASHAAWINTLYYKMKAGMVVIPEQRFPVAIIEATIADIEKKKEQAQAGNVTSLGAMEIAVQIEGGMLESKFFEVIANDNIELQIILEALRLGTQQHLQEIKRERDREAGGAEFEKLTA
jgi:hypothetical protein